MFKWILGILIVLLQATLLGGCARKNSASEATYLLPWSDAQGHYELQEVSISTLTSPYEAKGEAAEIYFEPTFSEHGLWRKYSATAFDSL